MKISSTSWQICSLPAMGYQARLKIPLKRIYVVDEKIS